MLLEFFGEHILQPRRDIFEQATGPAVTQSINFSFLTRAEAEVAIPVAKQHDLISVNIDYIRPSNSSSSGRGKLKGRGRGQLRPIPSAQPPAQ